MWDHFLRNATFWLPLTVYTILLFVDAGPLRLGGDGYYSWIFARSAALDGDLNFANDYAQCGDRLGVGLEWVAGRPDNPFYVGGALLWAPLLAMVRGAAALTGELSWLRAHSCSGSFVRMFLVAGPLAGAISVHVAYLCAKRVAGMRAARWSTWAWGFGIPMMQYSGIDAHYSHVYLTALVAAWLWWLLEAPEQAAVTRRWLFIGAAICFGITMMRITAVTLLLPALASLLARHNSGKRFNVALLLAPAIGASSGIACMFAIYMYTYGNALHVPQGPYFFHFDNAHPWLVLFGIHGGFFFWSPFAWVGLAGVIHGICTGKHKALHGFFLTSFAFALYLDSTVLNWDGDWSLGARRLVPFTPVFVLWTAIGLRLMARRFARSNVLHPGVELGFGAAAIALGISGTLTASGAHQVTQREVFGEAIGVGRVWAPLDKRGIDLALLPAELYYALRYGMPWSSYRAAITPYLFRDYLSLAPARDVIDRKSVV